MSPARARGVPPSVSAGRGRGSDRVRGIRATRGVPGRWPFPEVRSRATARTDAFYPPSPAQVRQEPKLHAARRAPTSSAVGDASGNHPALDEPSCLPQGSQRPPLRQHPTGVHSHGLAPASARALPARELVPSSPFLPVSTASSTDGSVGLLHPTADPGVHRVSAYRRRMPATPPRVLTDARPPELFPPEKSSPRHHGSCAPLPFADDRRRDFEALLRSGIRSDVDAWPRRTARCSPGLPTWSPPRPRTLRHAR